MEIATTHKTDIVTVETVVETVKRQAVKLFFGIPMDI